MDLAVASPATVSRCGMVYMDAEQMGWRPLTLSWLAALPPHLPEPLTTHLLGLFDWLLPVALRFLRRELREASPTLNGNIATALQRTFSACAAHLADPERFGRLSPQAAEQHVEALFLFALVWAVGGTAADAAGRAAFDRFLRAAAACKLHGARLLGIAAAASASRAWLSSSPTVSRNVSMPRASCLMRTAAPRATHCVFCTLHRGRLTPDGVDERR